MNESTRESLSALLDGEANELELERLLRAVGTDQELRQTLSRYSAVRAALDGHTVTRPAMDVSLRVRAALAGDRQTGSAPAARRWQVVLRPVAGFAVAASVAATAVIGGQQLAQLSGSGARDAAPTVAASASPVGMLNSLGASAVPASYGTQALPVLQPATRSAYQQLARQRMDRYIQEHAEHAALNTPQGLVFFARVPEIQR